MRVNKELWNKFLNNKVVVNCQTEDEAKEFLKYCDSQDLKWCTEEKITLDDPKWEYGEETCYRNDKYGIHLADISYYQFKLTIITYQQLISTAKEECTLGEEKQTYTIQEVFEFPENTEFICQGILFKLKSKIPDYADNIIMLIDSESNVPFPLTQNSIKFKFILVEKEYMMFEQAICMHKKFKYREWDKYYTLKDAVVLLSDYSSFEVDRMINEKAWEVEE